MKRWIAAGFGILVWLSSTASARADNCGSLSDCYNYIAVAALVVALIALGIALAVFLPEIFAAEAAATAVGLSEVGTGMAEVGGFLEGAGPWVAEGINVTEGGAVAQSLGGSCVSACGEMLSGGAMSEGEFLAQIGEWSNPGALAEALNTIEGAGTWQGGYFAGEADAIAAAQQGRIGAVLQAPGAPAHMVVIEPAEGGMFLVQDPGIGGTYQVTIDWIAKWVAGGVW